MDHLQKVLLLEVINNYTDGMTKNNTELPETILGQPVLSRRYHSNHRVVVC